MLSYLIPDGQYEFFREIVPRLQGAGIDVAVNRLPRDADLVLCGILPITHEWIAKVQVCGKPYILWHWDLYSFTDYREPRWQDYLSLLPGAVEVWSCGYEVARQLKEVYGLDSQVVPAWVDPANWTGLGELQEGPPYHYEEPTALYAASGNGFGKRVEWATKACKLLGIGLRVLCNQGLPRYEYFRHLAACRLYLCTAWEESNGTIPAMEAAAMGKPLVMADLPGTREVFSSPESDMTDLFYFQPWNFAELRQQLKQAWWWAERKSTVKGKLQERILGLYGIDVVAARIVERLRHVQSKYKR